MGMNKDETAISVGLALLMFAGKKATAASGKPVPKVVAPDPATDGALLLKRANQASATAWASIFTDLPTSPLTAQALARWAGIESSGKPVNPSRLNERGLMQAGPQSVSEGLLTAAEWTALNSPSTPKKEHARIAVKYVDGLANKAKVHVPGMGPDPIDRIWFAKLWHQWPVDVRDEVGPLAKELGTSDALSLAHALAPKWAGDPKRAHRLRAANVIAFGAAQ